MINPFSKHVNLGSQVYLKLQFSAQSRGSSVISDDSRHVYMKFEQKYIYASN